MTTETITLSDGNQAAITEIKDVPAFFSAMNLPRLPTNVELEQLADEIKKRDWRK